MSLQKMACKIQKYRFQSSGRSIEFDDKLLIVGLEKDRAISFE